MARFKIMMVLESVWMPVSEIALEGGFVIREATKRDLDRFKGSLPTQEYISLKSNEYAVKIVEQERDVDVKNVGELYKWHSSLGPVLTALRLLKEGTIGSRFACWQPLEQLEETIGWIENVYFPNKRAVGEGAYQLEEKDITELESLWKGSKEHLFRLDELGPLQVAVSRFETSYHKHAHADKFLDLMIAMEALYLKKGEMQELPYRMSQRAALLLESEPNHRKTTRDRIQNLYKIRNDLVHGASLKVAAKQRSGSALKDMPEAEMVSLLKDYVRSSIRKFLPICEGSKSIDKELDTLDDRVLD